MLAKEAREISKLKKKDIIEQLLDKIRKSAKDGEYSIEHEVKSKFEADDIRFKIKRYGYDVTIVYGVQKIFLKIMW